MILRSSVEFAKTPGTRIRVGWKECEQAPTKPMYATNDIKANFEDFNIVRETIKLIDDVRKQELLEQAVASVLARAVSKTVEPELQVRQLFHKAQSLMPAGTAQEFAVMIEREYGIDARMPKYVTGPKRQVADFITKEPVRKEKSRPKY